MKGHPLKINEVLSDIYHCDKNGHKICRVRMTCDLIIEYTMLVLNQTTTYAYYCHKTMISTSMKAIFLLFFFLQGSLVACNPPPPPPRASYGVGGSGSGAASMGHARSSSLDLNPRLGHHSLSSSSSQQQPQGGPSIVIQQGKTHLPHHLALPERPHPR